MITIEFYWNDLTEKKQNDIMETLHMKPGDRGWNSFPIVILDVDEDGSSHMKEQEPLTVEPKRIELPDETKAWLDKMDAVDVLANIANICIDWDGYRTANGLGSLINEIWAYARYSADRLLKTQEPQLVIRSRDYIEGTVLR